jgi:hypothetical protein
MNVQDKLLADTVRELEKAMEAAAAKGKGFSWSWVAAESGISTTTIANWRKRKTRSGLTRTMNAALAAVGKTLYIGNVRK